MTALVSRLLLFGTTIAITLGDCDLGNQPIILTDWTGSIISPGFDNSSYPNNQNCTWLIKVGSGSTIRLTFDTFDIEEGYKQNEAPSGPTKCEFDSVSITDSNRSLFKGCGKRVAIDPIDSITNRVTVTFVSDDGTHKSGFRLNYTGVCNRNITHPGQIELPNFPKPPPAGLECHWFLTSNKAVMIVRLGQEINDLPRCNHTPIMVRELVSGSEYNICLTDYLAFSHRDLELIYKVDTEDQGWGGKLEIAHEVSFNCKTFCRNESTITCLDGKDLSGRGYGCICAEGYTGTNCEARLDDLDPCYSQPCYHSGVCTPLGSSFKCSCIPGYNGSLCQNDIDECLNVNVCQNGATCVNKPGSFDCTCADGYTGSMCQTEILECSSSPCPENATCKDKVGSYECICPEGYAGDMCEIITCGAKPCENGGTCSDVNTHFVCSCMKGFKGVVCEVPFDACDWEPCQHGGSCTVDGQGLHCMCAPEYTGSVCSILKDSAHCLSDTDVVFGSGITWADTLANHEDVQQCPPGILGVASRLCVYNSLSSTGGSWVRPDLSKCVTPQILQINKEANLLRINDTVTSAVVLDLARRLANATAVVQDNQGARLYPGDLSFATGIIETIVDAVLKTSDVDNKMEKMVQGYGEAIDNLVDPSTAIIWKNARASLVDEKMTSLMTSTEMLADNLWSVYQKAERRRRDAGLRRGHDEVDDVTVDIITKNMEFAIRKFGKRRNTSSSALPPFSGRLGRSSIQLPGVVVDIAREGQLDGDVSVYYGKFPTVSALFAIREDRHNRTHANTTAVVNSDVVSTKVLGISENRFQDLKQEVVITFAYKNASLKESLEETCVFLNMSAVSSADRWSTHGCYVDHASNATHAICRCNHLTNFALLMDLYGTSKALDDTNDTALSAISYVGGCLSILACLLSIAVFEYFRLRNDRIRIHENLAAAIICVQVVFLIGFGRAEKKGGIHEWACKTVAVLMHFFLTAMFCWMLVEGIHLYVALVRVFKRGNHLRKYLGIGWGVPFVVVGISFAVFYEHYGNGDICWLNNDTLLVCFVPTVGLVVIINTVVLIIVLRVMMRSLHSTTKVTVQEKSSLKMGLKATAILLPLLGLTWTLAFFTVSSERDLAIVFTYLFTISNSFQGVMFFVFHCLLNVDIHSAFDRRYPRKRKMSSSDTSMTKVKRSSSLGVCLNEPPRGKPSVDTQFTDVTANGSRHSSISSTGHQHLHKQLSSHSNSSSNGHVRLIDQTSALSDGYGNDHRPLERLRPSGVEEFDTEDKDQIWRGFSLEHEEAFPDVIRENSAFHPDVVFVNSWGFETKHRKDSATFSDLGEHL